MTRIPLWVDVSHIADGERAPYVEAAKAAAAERILEAPAEDATPIRIRGPADQQLAATAPGTVVVESDDWTIIPLENLIAARRDQPGTLFAVAKSTEEAMRFRHVLDVGVHGIVLRPTGPNEVTATAQALEQAGGRLTDSPTHADHSALTMATVTSIEDVGMAERVCVDCTERFRDGEGLLIGSTAASFALIHAETVQSEFVNTRPFRVNAGAIHSYIVAADGQTAYLSELQSGHRITSAGAEGKQRTMTVGRIKIEHRPHVKVAWSSENGRGSVIVQWAETIRFTQPGGAAPSVTNLKVGDSILVRNESSARHMGMPIEERLVEK